MNGEKGDIAIDEVTFTRNQNCSFIPDFARSTYTAGKQNISWFSRKSSILIELQFRELVFDEEGKQENPEKNPRSKTRTNNKLNPHVAKGRNRTQATLVGGERSHHCAISASKLSN